MVEALSCSLGLLRYMDRVVWPLDQSRLLIFSQQHKYQDLCCGTQIHTSVNQHSNQPKHRLVASGKIPFRESGVEARCMLHGIPKAVAKPFNRHQLTTHVAKLEREIGNLSR